MINCQFLYLGRYTRFNKIAAKSHILDNDLYRNIFDKGIDYLRTLLHLYFKCKSS